MKPFTALRALFAASWFCSMAAVSAAPSLLVIDGLLMGATGVDVAGTLYTVGFAAAPKAT